MLTNGFSCNVDGGNFLDSSFLPANLIGEQVCDTTLVAKVQKQHRNVKRVGDRTIGGETRVQQFLKALPASR